jgi:hypothetical protein
MSHGAGGGKLDVGAWRLEEVAGVAASIHISSPVLFLPSFSFFMFHISCFKNTSGMNSVGSLRKIFDRTA